FARKATGFFRIGLDRRAVAYVLEGSGMIDDVPIKFGSGAFLENMAAVAIGGSPGYRILLASVPVPAEHEEKRPDAVRLRVKRTAARFRENNESRSAPGLLSRERRSP